MPLVAAQPVGEGIAVTDELERDGIDAVAPA